jgi:RimJ/RimL family protein N-acetyltransferase
MQVNNEIPMLSNEKVLLRPFKKNDLGYMYDNWSYEDDNMYFSAFSPHVNHEMRLSRIQNILDSYLSNNRFIWAIEYSKKVVGSIEVVDIENDYSTCEIDCYLSNELNDTSLLNESIKLADDYLMKVIGVKDIEYKELQTSLLTV